jgi:hypothetical protein
VQQEITVAISAKLRERLSGDNKAQIAKGGTNSPEAYQLYLKGIYYWGKRTPEGLEKSKEYFNQAIEKDPSYANAYMRDWRTITFTLQLPTTNRFPRTRQLRKPRPQRKRLWRLIVHRQTPTRHWRPRSGACLSLQTPMSSFDGPLS